MNENRILVVDDDDAIRALLLTVLRRRRYRVDTATNGLEALEKLGRCRYALVLLDMMMPHVNGYEVLEHLSRIEKSARPLVIVLTAGMEPRDLDPSVVAATMRKPFDVPVLTETIAACLHVIQETEQNESCPPPDSDGPSRPFSVK